MKSKASSAVPAAKGKVELPHCRTFGARSVATHGPCCAIRERECRIAAPIGDGMSPGDGMGRSRSSPSAMHVRPLQRECLHRSFFVCPRVARPPDGVHHRGADPLLPRRPRASRTSTLGRRQHRNIRALYATRQSGPAGCRGQSAAEVGEGCGACACGGWAP